MNVVVVVTARNDVPPQEGVTADLHDLVARHTQARARAVVPGRARTPGAVAPEGALQLVARLPRVSAFTLICLLLLINNNKQE